MNGPGAGLGHALPVVRSDRGARRSWDRIARGCGVRASGGGASLSCSGGRVSARRAAGWCRGRRPPHKAFARKAGTGEFMYRRYAAGSELLAQTAACTRLEPRLALRGISCHSKAHGPARALKPRVEPGVRRTPFPTPPVASRHALSFGRQTAGRRSRRGLRNRRLGVRALYTDNDRKPACAYAYAYAYSAACMRPDATGCDEKGLIPEDAIRARRTLEAPFSTGLPA
jgi:hypothetical protein